MNATDAGGVGATVYGGASSEDSGFGVVAGPRSLPARLAALGRGYAAVREAVWLAELAATAPADDAAVVAHLNRAAAIADRLRREADEIAWAVAVAGVAR